MSWMSIESALVSATLVQSAILEAILVVAVTVLCSIALEGGVVGKAVLGGIMLHYGVRLGGSPVGTAG